MAGCSSAEEMVGRSPVEFVVPDHRDWVRQQMEEALAGNGRVLPAEYRGVKMDGTTIPVEVIGRRINFDGQAAIVSAIRDLTLRRLAETVRVRAEQEAQLFKYVIEHSAVAAAMVTPSGGYFYVNDALCRALGYNRAELLALPVHETVPRFTPDEWQKA